MRTHNLIAETTVYEAADRVTANAPPAVTLGRFDIELEPPGPPRRPSPSLAATRIDGAWRRGRRSGRVTVDIVAVAPWGALVTVVLHDVPRRYSDDVAWQLARLLEDRAEAEPTPPEVRASSPQGTSSTWSFEGTLGVAVPE